MSKRQSGKIGMTPGAYVFLGEKKQDTVQMNLMDYDLDEYTFNDISHVEDAFACIDKESISWLNVYGLHDIDLMNNIQKKFNIHPLVIEDILNTHQRPKIEIYDQYIFIVTKMIYFDEETSDLVIEQISLIVLDNFVLCFQEKKGDIFNPLRERIKNHKGRIRKSGVDYLMFAILDIIVDHYFVVLEQLDEEIEVLDEELSEKTDFNMGHKIKTLKHNLIMLRKHIWPLRDVVSTLIRDENVFIETGTMPFLRDLHDHVIQVVDTTEGFREMAAGLMDMHMAAMSNRMNEIMKVLTIIATIFIPLSFLAGVFGMNFDTAVSPYNMPELHYKYGYIVFWLITLLVGFGLIFYFKRKKWL